MSVQFLAQWNGFERYQIVNTLSAAEETRLVGLGICQYYYAPSSVSGAGNSTARLTPSGYAASPGYVFDALVSAANWQVNGTGGSVAPATLADGSAGLQLTVAPGAGNQVLLTYTGNDAAIQYDQSTVIGLWVEVSDPGRAPGVQLLVSTETGQTFTNWVSLQLGTSGGDTNKNLYFINACIADGGAGAGTGATGGAAFGAGKISSLRIRITSTYKNQGGTVKIRALTVNRKARPKVAIVFDDNYRRAWTEACRIMSASGYVGTIAVNSALVNGVDRMTTADCLSARAIGWELCSHTPSHVAFNSYNLNSICAAQQAAGAGNLLLNGTVGAAAFDAPRHLVFRTTGADQGVKVTVNAIKNGQAYTETVFLWANGYWVATAELVDQVVSLVIDQATAGNVTVGQSLSEAEMRSAITTSTQWLIDNGMPPDPTKLMFVYPQGEFNNTSTRLLQAMGYSRARIVGGRRQNPQVGDFRPLEICGFGGTAANSAQLDAYVDLAIREGSNTCVYLHDFTNGAPGAGQTAVSVFQTFWDNLMGKVAAGKIDVVRLSDLPVA